MIYLNAEVISGLGEDTFWSWFHREFSNSSFEVPKKLNNNDVLLRYSTLGFLPIEGKQVALCWELYPQMKEIFKSNQWDERLKTVYQTARYSTYRTVATKASVADYDMFGSVNIIPIGVDTDTFKPLDNKMGIRNKYNIPLNKKVGVWVGTLHPMKGFSELLKYSAENSEIYWIVIWKWEQEAGYLDGASNFVKVPQEALCELLNAADFFLSTSKLKPFYMAEWEAMACNIPFVILGNKEREFIPKTNPRDTLFEMEWDRKTVKTIWEKFFIEKGVEW